MDEGIRELNELILEMAAWKVRHKDVRLDEETVVRIQALTRLLLENPRELKEKKVAQVGSGPLKGKCRYCSVKLAMDRLRKHEEELCPQRPKPLPKVSLAPLEKPAAPKQHSSKQGKKKKKVRRVVTLADKEKRTGKSGGTTSKKRHGPTEPLIELESPSERNERRLDGSSGSYVYRDQGRFGGMSSYDGYDVESGY